MGDLQRPFRTTMKLRFHDSVGAQARQWFTDVLASSKIDFDAAITTTVTVIVVAQPSAPGHNDYACTSAIPGGWLIEIRRGLDDPASPLLASIPGPAHLFFMETVAHELAHVLMGQNAADPAVLCPLFVRTGLPGTLTVGTVADWNISTRPSVVRSKWEDRIEEAVAEVVKDAALPDRRVYDNRTNWRLPEANFAVLMSALLGGSGGVGFYEDFSSDPTGNWRQIEGEIVVQAGAAYAAASPHYDENSPVYNSSDTVFADSAGQRGGSGAAYFWPFQPPQPLTVSYSLHEAYEPCPDASVTFKIISQVDGRALTPELTASGIDQAGSYGPVVMDIADGQQLCWECVSTSNLEGAPGGVYLYIRMDVPVYHQQFIYTVPVNMPAGWRIGCKAVFAAGHHEGSHCALAMFPLASFAAMEVGVSDETGELVAGVVAFTAGDPFHVEETLDIDYFAAGGTWWFTLEVNAQRNAIRGAIWSSEPQEGATPDYSYEGTGLQLDRTVMTEAVFGGGGPVQTPGAAIPVSDTHYDDWFAVPLAVEPPDWPYVPAFVIGAAGAPAALRVG
jgi:hypothetical protein